MAYGESRRSAKLTKKCLTLPIKSNFRDSKVNLKTLRPSLIIVMTITLAALTGCWSSRHVPQGSYLLDEVEIKVNDSTHTIDRQEMLTYLRQQPNHKMLWSTKFRLGVYNMSGSDTTRWWNRWIRKLGEAPVIYDSTLRLNSSIRRSSTRASWMRR